MTIRSDRLQELIRVAMTERKLPESFGRDLRQVADERALIRPWAPENSSVSCVGVRATDLRPSTIRLRKR